MKTKQTILVGYIKPLKIKLVQIPQTIKAKMIRFVNDKYFYRKDPLKMLQCVPAINIKADLISKINVTINKKTKINKVDLKKLSDIQSDLLQKTLKEKQEQIKADALKKWHQNQNIK